MVIFAINSSSGDSVGLCSISTPTSLEISRLDDTGSDKIIFFTPCVLRNPAHNCPIIPPPITSATLFSLIDNIRIPERQQEAGSVIHAISMSKLLGICTAFWEGVIEYSAKKGVDF